MGELATFKPSIPFNFLPFMLIGFASFNFYFSLILVFITGSIGQAKACFGMQKIFKGFASI